ncbi:BAR domain-containing protein [Histoplasma capsulatum G186AR]|uniref:BAR domain-containing protein n=3 Tax=Ajellomyces capsulatus TaxID=5037 RepID=C0NQZ2_AJECG|nr:BAR domain-containing protein [Histoplasma capsulatum G186AR]EEH06106.1 BAR domain-containing protein [Histoplasma capsulatum G186AR]KAG5293433.1 BAR domain-containing protein [Histoplasma capsulatum]QSS74883.1 BAR domain-containing protein [Histoplasma capsulatum G186AR]
MNVNKKIGRFKQWAGERMGSESKTTLSDDFKALEVEMNLRHEGMEKLQKSMTTYVKALSKRNEGDDKEKTLPIGYMGSTMVNHGEDFENASEFGQCLISFGRTNERIARIQETYIANATSSWLESLERSLVQMKEYQNARKKLETRRIAYDASLTKMQKAKREDFRAEEELRNQKAKYEESTEDVYRRMEDIKEAEADSIADLGAFLDAELKYYDQCREVLLQLKNNWPAGQTQSQGGASRRPGRNQSNTAHAYHDRYENTQEGYPVPSPEPRPAIKSNRAASTHQNGSPPRGYSPESSYRHRPSMSRNLTFEGPSQLRSGESPALTQRLSRTTSDNTTIRNGNNQQSQLQVRTVNRPYDNYPESPDDSYGKDSSSSPDRYFTGGRSISPATSHGSYLSQPASMTGFHQAAGSSTSKKPPPPPPPSRAKKPPPPPPPGKKTSW